MTHTPLTCGTGLWAFTYLIVGARANAWTTSATTSNMLADLSEYAANTLGNRCPLSDFHTHTTDTHPRSRLQHGRLAGGQQRRRPCVPRQRVRQVRELLQDERLRSRQVRDCRAALLRV